MSETQAKLAIRTTSKALTTKYDIMFDRDIENSQEFHEEFYTMRQASEGDLVNIYMDSMGGACSTISTFEHIKSKSSAHFHGILQGKGFSAGSAIFLLCDTHEVGELSEMMIHTSQQGMRGHSDEIQEFGNQSARTARIMMEKVYKDFLSEEEIEQCLIGKSIWLDATQIKERLAKREEVRNQQAIEEAKETYTPEVYATQCVLDITEDCESFGYDPVEIIKEMLEQAFEAQESEVEKEESEPEVVETVNIAFDGETVHLYEESIDLYNCTHDALRYVGNTLGIKFSHNIGTVKLRQRILDFLNEED